MSEKTEAKEAAAKKTNKAPTKKKSKKAAGLKLMLVKSLIGSTKRQRETVKGLGLRRIRHTVELKDTPEIRGMVTKVAHLIRVIEG
jgi:large subunit ribosomal protein L30